MIQKEEHNSEIFLRPRFTIECKGTVSEVMNVFSLHLDKEKNSFRSRKVNNHFFIDIPQKETAFWSPQLQIEVVEEDNQTKIKGLFGPKPQVWTFFMFLHFGVATAFIGFGILFYVKNKLGGSVVFPVVMLVALPIIWFVLYFLGSIGKEKSKPQINTLKQFVKKVLKKVD